MLAHSVRLHHPNQIAHQVSAPDVPSAISDLVQGAINQPMSIYEMGPAAHAMERVVVEWMTEKVGWPAGSGGVLTHGGSLANLTVLLAARAAAAPDAWVEGVDGTLAVLAPPGSHYSVKRSVAMLGLGERAVVDLEVDEYERIVPAALGDALARCEAGGPPPDGAGGGRVRHEHGAARRPRGDRGVLPRARDLVPRGRGPRRHGAAVAGTTGTC